MTSREVGEPLGLIEYMWERQAATDRRAAGLPRPWSTDPIIATRFLCSVFRDDDRTSREARAIVQESGREELAIMFRWVNKVDTLRALEEARVTYRTPASRITKVLRSLPSPLNTRAYRINTPDGLWDLDGVGWLIERALNCLHPVRGTARENTLMFAAATGKPFISYQVMQDLRWLRGEYPDEQDWALIGVGALRGLDRFRGFYVPKPWEERRNARYKPKYDERLTLRDEGAWVLMRGILRDAREALGARVNMFEVQNNLCEWDKYRRYFSGESKGKTFQPRED
jgi:hypothetical protein